VEESWRGDANQLNGIVRIIALIAHACNLKGIFSDGKSSGYGENSPVQDLLFVAAVSDMSDLSGYVVSILSFFIVPPASQQIEKS
jgi:hypothetical protein